MKREEREMLKKELVKEMPIPFNALKVYEKRFKYHALQFRNKHYCGCCGKELNETEIKKMKCECGAKLEPIPSNKKRKSEMNYSDSSAYYTITSSIKNTLVIRTFVIWLTETRMEKHSDIACIEVMRLAINEKGERIFARRPTWSCMWNWDWKYNEAFEIKPLVDRYDFNASYIGTMRKPKWLKYIDLKDLPKINNFKKAYEYSVRLGEFVQFYAKRPTYTETLLKLKRYDLLWFASKYGYYEETMRLARKNKEIPTKDLYTYKDYLKGLEELGKDLRNIDVICPKDFVEANKSVEKQCKKLHDMKELSQNVEQYNKDYVARISSLIGMDFGNEKYHITILTSVNDFYEEAKSMCHCVYRMGYYKKAKSYIFSVRNKENKRLETAEIVVNDKKKLAIQQCYGYGDKYTEYHTEIINLLNTKLNEIKGALLQ